MAKNVPPGYDDVTWVFTCSGSTKEVTWSCGYKWNSSPPTPAETAEDIYTWSTDTGTSPFKASLMLQDWAFEGVSVSRGTSTGPLVGQYFAHLQGTAGQLSVPMNSAILMRKNSASGGRAYRGRAFLPPIWVGEAHIDVGGNIEGAYVASVQSYMDNLFERPSSETLGGKWFLYHTILDGVSLGPTELTSWSVQSKIATQRRRLR